MRHAFVVCVAGLLLLSGARLAAAEKGSVKAEKVEYGGWKNNLKISNGDAELVVTLDVGPRIISYRLKGGKNVLKEYKDQLGKGGESTWKIRGGHRLWLAPEDPDRTYTPDNEPVSYSVQEDTGAVRVTQKPDRFGFVKEMEIRLEKKGSGVTVIHRVTNGGEAEAKLALWALTVVAPGGMEIIPLPPKKPHPGGPKGVKAEDYWPNQNLVMWPYFDFRDPRWYFGTKYITLKQQKRGPTKIGLLHREGWVSYLNDETLFTKIVSFDEGATYPDKGSNYQTFTNEDMLELETLAPLLKLPPKATTEHHEYWMLHGGIRLGRDEDAYDKDIPAEVRTRKLRD
jgi:hypothetical protein